MEPTVGLTPDEVRRLTIDVVQECSPERTAISDTNMHFIDDLGYHSIALMELGFALEDKFNLPPIEAEDVEGVETVEQLISFISSRVIA